MSDKRKPQILHAVEWIDYQPNGFLSGNVTETPSFDVYTEPTENSIPFIEHSAYLALESEALKLEAALTDARADLEHLKFAGYGTGMRESGIEALSDFEKWRGGE